MSTTETLARAQAPMPPVAELPEIMVRFAADPVSELAALTQRFGPVFRLPLGAEATVFLNEGPIAEKVLRLDFSSFGMSQQTERLNRPLLGRSMPVTSDQRYWEELHAVILPMFTPAMLKSYFTETVKVVAEEVEHLAKAAREGRTVPLLDFVRTGVFTALSRTLFARGVSTEDIPRLLSLFESSNRYMSMRYLQGEAADVSEEPPIVAGRKALADLDAYIRRLIAQRRDEPPAEAQDMLDVLVGARTPAGRALDDDEVRDNVMALFFGGQETTPSVITWALGLLSAHPHKREQLEEEVDRVLGDRTPTWEDLKALKYADMVLDETVRLYPPFSFVGREALEDVELGDFHVPAGSPIAFVGWTIHRNPADWPDPEVFEPSRHVDELRKVRNRCAFVGFGYGQRRCTGERVGRMEGVLMLAMIAQRLRLDRVGGGLSAHQVMMAIKPADGMPVTVSERRR